MFNRYHYPTPEKPSSAALTIILVVLLSVTVISAHTEYADLSDKIVKECK